MTLTIPTDIPESVTAGDTIEFTQTAFEIPGGFAAPVDGWTLAVRIISDPQITAVCTDDDLDTYTVTIAASLTDAIVTETVARIVGYVTGAGSYAGRRYQVIDQTVVIAPNPARATAANLLTHAERTLAVIEAAIEGNASSAIQSYSIGGRSVSKYSPAELMGLRARYAYQVKLDRNGGATLTAKMAFNASR